MSAPRYDNPQALRQALSDRLRPVAAESGMELSALPRQGQRGRQLGKCGRAGGTRRLRPYPESTDE